MILYPDNVMDPQIITEFHVITILIYIFTQKIIHFYRRLRIQYL